MNTLKIFATFTLQSLKAHYACSDGYNKLIQSLPSGFPEDQPIPLLQALASNSVQDVFWALRAVEQDLSSILGPLSADVAEAVLPILEKAFPNDDRPGKAIEAARAGDLVAAYAAASDAAAYAAAAAAYAAAYAAADTYYAAADAAADTYYAAADAAADTYYAADAAAYAAAYAAADTYYAAADAASYAVGAAADADFDRILIEILKTYFSE